MPLARSNRMIGPSIAVGVVVCVLIVLAHTSSVGSSNATPGQITGAAPSAALDVLEVRPNFFVIAGAGGNIGVQVGDDGVVVVDAGSAASAPADIAAI
jgi:hypothetical protein